MDKEEEAKKDPSGFQPAKDILNQPKRLPNDWEFGRIESSGNPEGDSGDTSYIYFFSQGVSEEAIIQLTNKNKTTWTLHLNAVISQPEIYQEAKTLKDLSQ